MDLWLKEYLESWLLQKLRCNLKYRHCYSAIKILCFSKKHKRAALILQNVTWFQNHVIRSEFLIHQWRSLFKSINMITYCIYDNPFVDTVTLVISTDYRLPIHLMFMYKYYKYVKILFWNKNSYDLVPAFSRTACLGYMCDWRQLAL